MREISIVLSNIYICNKICERDTKKQTREGNTSENQFNFG